MKKPRNAGVFFLLLTFLLSMTLVGVYADESGDPQSDLQRVF
jgi:hypothetical protein